MNGFDGYTGQENDRVEKILSLTERIERISSATNRMMYNEELVTQAPEVLKTLGAAKDAAIAELKTL
jgi:transcriptional regulator of nitric oxide reductase